MGTPITDAVVTSSDRNGPEEVEMKNSKREGKKKKKDSARGKQRFQAGWKKSHTEHHLVSKSVVQNTIKMTLSLPEKTSYLAIVTDAWCNDW